VRSGPDNVSIFSEVPRYDDEDTPSTRRERLSESDATALFNRKADQVLAAQQEKLAQFLSEREQRAEERQRYEAERRRKEREMTTRLEKLDTRISDLYSLDKRDVESLDRLKEDVKTTKSDVKDLLEELQSLRVERQEFIGMIKGFKWAVVGAAGAAGVIGPGVAWIFSKIHF